jgi:hypothetical protein
VSLNANIYLTCTMTGKRGRAAAIASACASVPTGGAACGY